MTKPVAKQGEAMTGTDARVLPVGHDSSRLKASIGKSEIESREVRPLDFSAAMSVREARDQYFAKHGLCAADYEKRLFITKVGFVPVPFPNPGLFHLHDLHHVATGFSTDTIGEAEISVFELRAGCRGFLVHLLCISVVFMVLFVAPRRLLRSFRRSRGARTLYFDPTPYGALLEMTVGELRAKLALPPDGLAHP